MAKTKKNQIIIDLDYKEIKYTNNQILRDLEDIFKRDLSITDYYKLKTFKIVNSLTVNKNNAPKAFKAPIYKSKKKDIINFLERKNDKKLSEEYLKRLNIEPFVIVNKDFNENVIKTEDDKKMLQEIIKENLELEEKIKNEKELTKKLREEAKAKREKEKEEEKKRRKELLKKLEKELQKQQ